jgi:hypothetical protein
MKKWFDWFFGPPHGVVGTDAKPHVFVRIKGWYLGVGSRPFRAYWPNGPTPVAFSYWEKQHKHLKVFKCKGCGCLCWGYKQQDYCGSWSCYEKVHK